MRPAELRPAFCFLALVNERSGVVFVISSNADTVVKRILGVVGLYFFNAIVLLPYQRV
jgi:hypothetical protein